MQLKKQKNYQRINNFISCRREDAPDSLLEDIDDEIDVEPVHEPPVKKRTRAGRKVKDPKAVLKCEKESCKDFGRVFKYASKKEEHDRYVNSNQFLLPSSVPSCSP